MKTVSHPFCLSVSGIDISRSHENVCESDMTFRVSKTKNYPTVFHRNELFFTEILETVTKFRLHDNRDIFFHILWKLFFCTIIYEIIKLRRQNQTTIEQQWHSFIMSANIISTTFRISGSSKST